MDRWVNHVKNSQTGDIGSKPARAKLKPSGKPYWHSIDIGLHLGYLKGLRGGRWVMRRYCGNEAYLVEPVGTADDHQDTDGRDILTFHQAQAKVRNLAKRYRLQIPGASPLTVKETVVAYLTGQKGRDQHVRLQRHVLHAEIADRPLASLTEAALAAWQEGLPATIAPTTVPRIITDFKASLNAAWKRHRKELPSDFPQIVSHGLALKEPVVAVARERQILPDADIRRLIDAAWQVNAQDGWNGDLARLIIVLAATGCRFSQAIRLTVSDVQSNRLMVPVSRKGRGAKSSLTVSMPIGQDVVTALRPAIIGRRGSEILLMRPFGAPAQTACWLAADRGNGQRNCTHHGPQSASEPGSIQALSLMPCATLPLCAGSVPASPCGSLRRCMIPQP